MFDLVDISRVQNGAYVLQLTVVGGNQYVGKLVQFILDTPLKIG